MYKQIKYNLINISNIYKEKLFTNIVQIKIDY